MRSPALILAAVAAAASAAPALTQQAIEAELFDAATVSPLFVCSAPGDDASRVFVLAKGGLVWIFEDGVRRATPFLDLRSRLTPSGEGGLLGIAFHPDYAANRLFFVNYTDLLGDTAIERYETDPFDPDHALPQSALTILSVDQPYANHNGGWLGFGPDGYLYVPLGDGGSVGDPGNRAQDGQQLLGKILRLDVDHPSGGLPYGIPPTNPFVGDPAVRDEIWALGLRNPWRCDFDPATGDLWIADVGQALWEEVDLQPAGAGGLNYGWRLMEAEHCYQPPVGCQTGALVLPVHEYAHGGLRYRCSVIGGEVYRGREMATMHGRYFFSDYCSGEVWSMRRAGAGIGDFEDHSAQLPFHSVVSMGEDADGELYVCADFAIYKIVPAGLRLRVPRLTAGGTFTAAVGGGQPTAATALFFSRTGIRQAIPPGAKLDLASPILIGTTTSDAGGAASFTAAMPARMAGRVVWVQAAQFGLRSNVVVDTVR